MLRGSAPCPERFFLPAVLIVLLAPTRVAALEWGILSDALSWETLSSAVYPEAIRWSGHLQNEVRRQKVGDSPSILMNNSSLQINASTFLWAPWIAQIDGGAGFSYSIRRNGFSQDNRMVAGNVGLRVFPQSRFPFHTYFDTRNNDVEGEILAPNRTLTNYGLEQSYSEIAGTRYRLRYNRAASTTDDPRAERSEIRDVDDEVNASANRNFGDHKVDLSQNFDRVDREAQDETNTRYLTILRHAYRPDAELTVGNILTYNNDSTDRSTRTIDNTLLQLSSNSFWRPAMDKPLVFTGTSLMQQRTNDQGAGESISRNGVISGQASYQWTPFTSIRGQLGANVSDNETATRIETIQRAGIDYSPAERPFLGMNYTYTLATDVANRSSNLAESRQNLTANVGHVLNRSLPLGQSFINLNASQRGTTVFQHPGKAERTLTHTLSADWNRSMARSSAQLRGSASDSRRFGRTEFGLQLVNLQGTGRLDLSRHSSLNGGVTFQMTRPLAQDNSGEQINFNTSIDVSYNHRRFFGVPRLSFISELRYMSNSIFELIESEGLDITDRSDNIWRNRLEYSIGRLDIRAVFNVGQNDETLNTLMFLQLRRSFSR